MLTVKEFFIRTGGDYDEILRRFVKEELIRKYLRRFPDDRSFEQLQTSLIKKDYKTALRSAHCFKGLCNTLGLANISADASELYSDLKNGSYGSAENFIPSIRAGYEKIIEWIALID